MIEYIVGPNDTLNKIAEYYGVSVDEIVELNDLNDKIIEEGMILKIPIELKIGYYTVLVGDDLYSIANKFDIPVETLSKLNGLKVGEYIYPNQKLIVPLEGYKVYITKNGDTIFGIGDTLDIPIENVIEGNPNLYLLPDQLIVYRENNLK